MDKQEQQRFSGSLIFSGILLLILWMVKVIELSFDTSFSEFGILPQSASGLRGILFSPLLHADVKHLSANSVPFFVLAAGLFYYYGKKSYLILLLSWLITGFWVWVFANDTGIHIGASGVVYALAAFHFTGGLLRREPRMMAFSMLVVFLYGGLVWGMFPKFYPENISWESHLLGALAGVVLAFAFRSEGPQRKVYHWDDDEDDIENLENESVEGENAVDRMPVSSKSELPDTDNEQHLRINYTFKEKE